MEGIELETWRKIYAVCLIVIGLVMLFIFVFVSGVFFGARYPSKSTDVAAGVFSSGNRSLDFIVTLDYKEYLHYEVASLTSGAEFNVSLTAHPIYGNSPSEHKAVTYKSLYDGFPGSFFGDSFDLLLPHPGPWKVQILAEGTGELDCKVTKITPGDATDLVASALTTILAIWLPSVLVLTIVSLVKWRKKPLSEQNAHAETSD